MARIPFELPDELKDSFTERMKNYRYPVGGKLTTSQILRLGLCLVLTMDDSQLTEYLTLCFNAESAFDEYSGLLSKYKATGLVDESFSQGYNAFDDVYALLQQVDKGIITEQEFRKQLHDLEVNTLVVNKLYGNTSEVLRKFRKIKESLG